jgi:hypothetical protein
MAIFSTCRKCGCKAVVVVVVGTLLHAAVHHQDVCIQGRLDRQALYCTKFVAEAVHTPEDTSSSGRISWVRVNNTTVTSSSAYSFGTLTVSGSNIT